MELIESVRRGQECSPEHASMGAHPLFGRCHKAVDVYLPHLRGTLKRQMLSGMSVMSESDRPTWTTCWTLDLQEHGLLHMEDLETM